jgi:hypothetical protein
MKKQLLVALGFATAIVILFACQKKNDKDAIAPTYGSTGNPYPNNQTVTGSTTYTSPATEPSVLSVGGSGWYNPTCLSTLSLTLRAYNGNTEVYLTFASAAHSGTYAVASMASSGACAMTVNNAPDQPAGVTWVGKAGTVVINTTSTSINATFTGVVCTQQTFNYPTVTVSGFLACSQ